MLLLLLKVTDAFLKLNVFIYFPFGPQPPLPALLHSLPAPLLCRLLKLLFSIHSERSQQSMAYQAALKPITYPCSWLGKTIQYEE